MIILGLGSNMGFLLKNLRTALHELQKIPELTIKKISSVYLSEAELPEAAPQTWKKSYLNVAVAVESSLTPRALQLQLQTIEEKMGRRRDQRWEPRLIDIDILIWNNESYEDECLTIPHRSLWNRPFALLPLLEIFPEFQSPHLSSIPWLKPELEAPFRTRKIKACLNGPALMGIVNVTPDSFSDGNQCPALESQLEQIKHLILSGAEIIDIGAESTRPQASPVSSAEEWKRLKPLMKAVKDLPQQLGIDPALTPEISLDTFHPETAERALHSSSIQWINDVSGESVLEMVNLIKNTNIRYVSMHHLGVPPSSQSTLPISSDPIPLLTQWTVERIHFLDTLGLKSSQVIMDLGIGFGLSPAQTWEVLKRSGEVKKALERFEVPLLIGHSRKSFLKSVLNEDSTFSRDFASSLIAFSLAEQKIDYLRVHAVSLSNQSMKVFSQLKI